VTEATRPIVMAGRWNGEIWSSARCVTDRCPGLRSVNHKFLATVYRVGQKHVSRQAPENTVSGADVKRAANDNRAWPID
jgi:hypothetical protein